MQARLSGSGPARSPREHAHPTARSQTRPRCGRCWTGRWCIRLRSRGPSPRFHPSRRTRCPVASPRPPTCLPSSRTGLRTCWRSHARSVSIEEAPAATPSASSRRSISSRRFCSTRPPSPRWRTRTSHGRSSGSRRGRWCCAKARSCAGVLARRTPSGSMVSACFQAFSRAPHACAATAARDAPSRSSSSSPSSRSRAA